MRLSVLSPFLLSLFLSSLLHTPTLAVKKSYVVYLGGHSHGPEPSSTDLDRAANSHHELLGSFLGSKEKAKDVIFYSYTRHINGFAAVLDEEEAAQIAKHSDVVSVFENQARKLHTTHSWDFLRVERNGVIPSSSIWKKARFGEGTIIGNIDSGVWPDSKSFSDEGMGPVPSKWQGFCEGGIRRNRKLIGARHFHKGYDRERERRGLGSLNSSVYTPHDCVGHGTHTLSTAGGSFVFGASVFGLGSGTAKGGSPKAHVAAYKACWSGCFDAEACWSDCLDDCTDADIMAAFEAAITDGVDVLSVSLGAQKDPGGVGLDYFQDGNSIGAFHAVKNGIAVVCSAGNDGPYDETVGNVSPWILTVGASTMDRDFTSYVVVGNKKHLKDSLGMYLCRHPDSERNLGQGRHKLFEGASLSDRTLTSNKFYPLISAEDARAANAMAADAKLCMKETLDANKVTGKILVCHLGLGRNISRLDKGHQAALAGAVGMILVHDELNVNDITASLHELPASHIGFTDGESVFTYINSTKSPMAYITPAKTQLGVKPAPVMASFSSRGPNTLTPEILKICLPDITAPGVSIIAAYSRLIPFNSDSGTSMSCSHVSGIAGLLKTLHPDWSPATIRSAIMTSARTRDNYMEPVLDSLFNYYFRATPFSYGAGHVRPNRAMDPGLVYDLTVNDYLNFLCAIGYSQTQIQTFADGPYTCPESFSLEDFNYPSITVPNLFGSVNITRRVKNDGPPGTYNARVKAPSGISVLVEPKKLKFEKTGEEKKFKLVLMANGVGVAKDEYVFGGLVWPDGKHFVRSPIVVGAK